MSQEFWRIGRVQAETGLCVSSIYELMAAGEFPKNFAISKQARAWLSDDIQGWKTAKLVAARKSLEAAA
jgi:prophage regulatory protein